MNNSNNNQQYSRRNMNRKEYGEHQYNINNNGNSQRRPFHNYNTFMRRNNREEGELRFCDQNGINDTAQHKRDYERNNIFVDNGRENNGMNYTSNNMSYKNNCRGNNYNKFNNYRNGNNNNYYRSNADCNKKVGYKLNRNNGDYNKNIYANKNSNDYLNKQSCGWNNNKNSTYGDIGNYNRNRSNVNNFKPNLRFNNYNASFPRNENEISRNDYSFNSHNNFNNRNMEFNKHYHDYNANEFSCKSSYSSYNNKSKYDDSMKYSNEDSGQLFHSNGKRFYQDYDRWDNTSENNSSNIKETSNEELGMQPSIEQKHECDMWDLKHSYSDQLFNVSLQTNGIKNSTTETNHNNTPVFMEEPKDEFQKMQEFEMKNKMNSSFENNEEKKILNTECMNNKEEKQISKEIISIAVSREKFIESVECNRIQSNTNDKSSPEQNHENIVLPQDLPEDELNNKKVKLSVQVEKQGTDKKKKTKEKNDLNTNNYDFNSLNSNKIIPEPNNKQDKLCTDVFKIAIKIYESDLNGLITLRNEISEKINILENKKRIEINDIAPFIVKAGIDCTIQDSTVSYCIKNDFFRKYIELTKSDFHHEKEIENYMMFHLNNSCGASANNEARSLTENDLEKLEYIKLNEISIPVEEPWSDDEERKFVELLEDGNKNFEKIALNLSKKLSDVILHYYRTKKKKIVLPIKRKAGRVSDENMKRIILRDWDEKNISLFIKLFEINGKDWNLYYETFPGKTEGDFKLLHRYVLKYSDVKPLVKKDRAIQNEQSMKEKYLSEFTIAQRQLFALYYPFIGRNWSEMSIIINKNINDTRGYYRYYFKKLSDDEQRFESNLQEIERDTNSCPSSPKTKNSGGFTESCGVLFVNQKKT